MAFTLSFDKGADNEAVAVVRGGDFDGELLYLHKPGSQRTRGKPRYEFSPTLYATHLKGLKPNERIRVQRTIEEGVASDLPDLAGESKAIKALYALCRLEASHNKAIDLPEGCTFEPIPSPDPTGRQIWYAAGASGSGKSHFARNIAANYRKLFPDREVYLISKLEKDDTLDNLKVEGRLCPPKRISLDSLVSDYPALTDFESCLVIFDDYDTLQAPHNKVVQQLIDDLAIQGRHTRTSMCVLSHYLTNYRQTRLILGEAHFLVLYPMATSYRALRYVLEAHAGMSREEVLTLKRRGRWICVHKVYPQYLISAQHAALLNQ